MKGVRLERLPSERPLDKVVADGEPHLEQTGSMVITTVCPKYFILNWTHTLTVHCTQNQTLVILAVVQLQCYFRNTEMVHAKLIIATLALFINAYSENLTFVLATAH